MPRPDPNLEPLLRKLEEVNAFYPATRDFLRSRGLDQVSELGRQGRRDLIEHLRSLLRRAVH